MRRSERQMEHEAGLIAELEAELEWHAKEIEDNHQTIRTHQASMESIEAQINLLKANAASSPERE